MLSTILDCILEQRLLEYPILIPVGTNTGPMRVLQVLIRFFVLEVILRRGAPHEVVISLILVMIHKRVSYQNIDSVSSPVTWGIKPGWEEIIWSTEFMAMGLIYEDFLINPHRCLPLVFHGLLRGLPNIQAMQGGSSLDLLRFLGIIPLLDNLMRYLKVKWFRMLFQTRISVSYRPKRSSVEDDFVISSLVSSPPEVSFYTSSSC